MKRILFLSLLFLGLSAFGQQTGSFELVIAFDEVDYSMTNELAFYVPTDYDASNSYPLIVGFRGGPHSGPDHLRDQLQPLSDSLDAIIMCPESVVLWQTSQEDLVKQLFQYAVDTTAAIYNVDMEMIYVTGLSFGGRHTVIVGMDTDAGPIYPGLRGIIPFAAGTNSENVADYDMNAGTPVCTCIGENDASFYAVSETLHTNATSNMWTTYFNEIPNVGHTMAFPTFVEEMMECFNFIEAQYVTNIVEFEELNFTLYPNPAAGQVSIEGLDQTSPLLVHVLDARGRVVLTTVYPIGVPRVTIDVSELKSGVYHVQLIDELSEGRSQVVSSRELIIH